MDILEHHLASPPPPSAAASASLFTRSAPRDGLPLYVVRDATREETDAALHAAAAAVPLSLPLGAIAAAVRGDCAAIEGSSDAAEPSARLAALEAVVEAVAAEVGRVREAVFFELHVLADCLTFYADLSAAEAAAGGRVGGHVDGHAEGVLLALPRGAVAVVLPWNFPVAVLAPKLAAAWAAGCPVVAKPSPLAARSVVLLARYLALLDVPAAALQVVHGGAAVGEQLVSHALAKAVAFTGSSAVGARIHALCAPQMKPCVLECGGKSSLLVLDADAAGAAAGALAMGLAFNAAQICTFPSRVLVHESARDAFLDALLAALAASDDVQPLISPEQFRKVAAYLRSAVAAGGRIVSAEKHEYLLAEEEEEDAHVSSLVFAPTVLTDVPQTAAAWNEEIFGPIAMVHAFGSTADAVRIANTCEYGLAAGVFASDEAAAVAVAKQLHAGTVYVNTYFGTEPSLDAHMPAGGWNLSGLGYECGTEGMRAFQKLQALHIQHPSPPQV